jgi:hypothetical protein
MKKRIDFFILLIFIIYMSAVYVPIDFLGFFESLIRLFLFLSFVNWSYFKQPFFLYSGLIASFSYFGGTDLSSVLITFFDFNIPFLILSKAPKSPINIHENWIKLTCALIIIHVVSAQFLNLDKIYFPYGESVTMGAFRNKAIYSVCFLIWYFIEKKNFSISNLILLSLLFILILISFRRTAWGLSLIFLSGLFNLKTLIKLIPRIIPVLLIVMFTLKDQIQVKIQELLAARSSEYLFTIDSNQWRVQEWIMYSIDTLNNPVLINSFGNFTSDPGGANFWGRLGVENFIHVDFIRLSYYFGIIGSIIYILNLRKLISKYRIKKIKLLLIGYVSVFIFSGGVLIHILNTSLLFILIYINSNVTISNHNFNIKY